MFKNTILGIDIGTSSIGFAMVEQGKKPYILGTALVATGDKIMVNGEIKELGILCNQINDVIDSKKFKPKAIALCINSPQIVSREFKIPLVKNNEIYQSIQLELSKSYPGIEQTHNISFKVYSKTKEFIEGIVTMCPSKILKMYEEISDLLSVSVKYIDVHSNSIAKTYKHFIMDSQDENTVLTIDMGCNTSQVNIVKGGKLILSRAVSFGGASIDTVIAKELDITVEEAEMQKFKKYKEYLEKGYDVDKLIKKGYAAIGQEIGQTINVYKQKYKEEEIKEILLIGGGSFIAGIEGYMKETFNINSTVVRPTHNNAIYVNQFAKLMAAIGCGIREECIR